MESHSPPTRRQFLESAAVSLAAVGFIQILTSCDDSGSRKIPASSPVVNSRVSLSVNEWSKRLNTYCRDLKKGTLSAKEWQVHLEDLFSKVALKDIIKATDFAKLSGALDLPDLGVSTVRVDVGEGKNVTAVSKLFGMREGRAVIPHGHSNMASAHFVLEGEALLRQYDKIGESKEELRIKKTVERVASPGDISSISDERDNVHWFIAKSGPMYTLDTIVLDLNSSRYEIHNIDIDRGVQKGDEILVPKMEVQRALAKYGKVDRS